MIHFPSYQIPSWGYIKAYWKKEFIAAILDGFWGNLFTFRIIFKCQIRLKIDVNIEKVCNISAIVPLLGPKVFIIWAWSLANIHWLDVSMLKILGKVSVKEILAHHCNLLLRCWLLAFNKIMNITYFGMNAVCRWFSDEFSCWSYNSLQ